VELIPIEELKGTPKIGLMRGRTEEKREKDRQHLSRGEEIARIFKEAYRDKIDSLGEVDALTCSEKLVVTRGDVLRDPKLRFSHPFLKFQVEDGVPESRREQLRKFGDEQGWTR
jgi:hypothetical protein